MNKTVFILMMVSLLAVVGCRNTKGVTRVNEDNAIDLAYCHGD